MNKSVFFYFLLMSVFTNFSWAKNIEADNTIISIGKKNSEIKKEKRGFVYVQKLNEIFPEKRTKDELERELKEATRKLDELKGSKEIDGVSEDVMAEIGKVVEIEGILAGGKDWRVDRYLSLFLKGIELHQDDAFDSKKCYQDRIDCCEKLVKQAQLEELEADALEKILKIICNKRKDVLPIGAYRVENSIEKVWIVTCMWGTSSENYGHVCVYAYNLNTFIEIGFTTCT